MTQEQDTGGNTQEDAGIYMVNKCKSTWNKEDANNGIDKKTGKDRESNMYTISQLR